LDGLLKIPFGIYKKHELLTFLNNFKTELNKTFDRNLQTELQIDDFLNYSGNFNKNFSSDSLHKLITSPMTMIESNSPIKAINEDLDLNSDLSPTSNNSDIEPIISSAPELSPTSPDLEIKQADLLKRWNEYKENKILYLKTVQKVLDSCVYGHVKSKEMVQKILAQWMNGQMKGNVLGMYGPPGIGKTTIIKNGLSKCLNDRPFEFLALGGKTHGNLLEGSNYTYVGSTWGKIVEMLIHAKCMNPIIYFDELDKISKSENGREIINILIHLTDPSQNSEFQDRYFSGIPLDLSKVLFVFSYNNRDEIDTVLLDRITEIEVEALNLKEKVVIVNDYILPEVLQETGYTCDDILFSDDVIEYIIDTYTYESGVRKLKECIIDLIRDINLRRTRNNLEITDFPFNVEKEFVDEVFKNNVKAIYRKISPTPGIGMINGLFANSRGQGGIITIECNKVIHNSKLGLELTGMQGDVMQESMKVARTVAWSLLDNTEKETIEKEWEKSIWGLHIHCPEGATPKQGPSAGGAITIAILSCLKQMPINNEVAITGEIELHGKITQIGGLQYKLNGAEKAGVKKVLIPEANESDLIKFRERFPESKLEIILINNIQEAISHFFYN
jgi:ATP-dependent Lon protease